MRRIDTTGDGGLFAIVGGGFLGFLLLVALVALLRLVFGDDVARQVLDGGLLVLSVLVGGAFLWGRCR